MNPSDSISESGNHMRLCSDPMRIRNPRATVPAYGNNIRIHDTLRSGDLRCLEDEDIILTRVGQLGFQFEPIFRSRDSHPHCRSVLHILVSARHYSSGFCCPMDIASIHNNLDSRFIGQLVFYTAFQGPAAPESPSKYPR